MCTLQKRRRRSQQPVGMGQDLLRFLPSIAIIILCYATVQAQQTEDNSLRCTRCSRSSDSFCGTYYSFRGAGSMTGYISNMYCSLAIMPSSTWNNADGMVLSVNTTMQPIMDYAVVLGCYSNAQGQISCDALHGIGGTAIRNNLRIDFKQPSLPTGFHVQIRVVSDSAYDSLCSDESSCNQYKDTGVAENKYIGANFSYALTCKPGYTEQSSWPPGCVMCAPGKFSDKSGSVGGCQTCAYDKFQPNPGQTSCQVCEVGSFASDPSRCETCYPGSYGGVSNLTVLNTDGTKESVTISISCFDCYPGKYNPSSGSTSKTSCLPCPTGKFASGPGKSACKLCSEGKYTAVEETQSCATCPKGKYNQIQGATNPETDCQLCAPGSISNEQGTACYSCGTGTYQNIPETVCAKCSPGTFADSSNTSECTPCPPGSFAQKKGFSP